MDLLYSSNFQLALLFVSLSLIFFIYRNKSVTTQLPPGRKGWPIIGETLAFVLAARKGNPEKFVTERTDKYSPEVFRTSLIGENVVVFCGAAGNKFLFSGQNKYISAWWPSTLKKILMFPSDENTKKDESKLRATFLPEYLKPESLRHYIPIMDSMAREHLQQDWSPHSEVKVFPLSKKYTFALACRLFMSVEDPSRIAKFAEPFALVTAGLMAVPINFLINFARKCHCCRKFSIRRQLLDQCKVGFLPVAIP